MTKGTKLNDFLTARATDFAGNLSDLQKLFAAITETAKGVAHDVARGGLADIFGAAGTENVQGEDQQKLNIIADKRFFAAFQAAGCVAAVASEEKEEVTPTTSPDAPYLIAIDPLDGSSNIDVNAPVGTIFGVFPRKPDAESFTEEFFRTGHEQVLAGFVLYGTATVLLFTTKKGTHLFTLDPDTKEFLLTEADMKIPANGKIYSCNEGGLLGFPESVQAYLADCKTKKYKARYIGSLVGDFFRNMLKGGVFLYPQTESAPAGKLRLLYECHPIALLTEQAKGKATTGKQNVLDCIPEKLHEQIPYIIGSSEMVNDFLAKQ